LVGGSGGGGGAGFSATTSCTGGGGGGGGGAILIAANGSITLGDFDIHANGGSGGSVGNGSGCARGGGGGAGGAIRLVANRFVHIGTARLFVNGGGPQFNANSGTAGRIRLESVDISGQTAFSPQPFALRVTGPGPLRNAVAPAVNITHINGNEVPVPPQGFRGSIDLTLPAPGVTSVDVATSGVPSGTTVEIKVKPRIGAAPQTALVPLSTCDAQGNCTATTTFNLSAGAYLVEARATFQVQ
jgi:hypothetical protein